MLVYTDYKKAIKDAPYCIALGSFDGVHLGHQKLIDKVVEKSKDLSCSSMVYTFLEHPKKILTPGCSPEMITENCNRVNIMEKLGLDAVYFENFKNVMNMDAETFVKEILISRFNIKCAVAGYNFSFGQEKDGDAEMLKEYGKRYGFEVYIVDAVKIDGEVVSSSLIRDRIKNGAVDTVKDYLGRYFSIDGVIIHGRKNGEKIGVRTANLGIDFDIVLPKPGVYLTDTIVNNRIYKSVTNIGTNPTFNTELIHPKSSAPGHLLLPLQGNSPCMDSTDLQCGLNSQFNEVSFYGKGVSIETHIIDFDGNLYGRQLEVAFLKRLRDERAFDNPLELKTQIMNDIKNRLEFNQ